MARGIDTRPYLEWLDGAESVAVSPNPTHGLVAMEFAAILDRCGSAFGSAIPEVHVRLDEQTTLLPDVAFYRYDALRALGPGQIPIIPPEVLAEVRSPNDRPGFRETKIARYLTWGCRLVFAIDTKQRTIRVVTTDAERVLTRDDDFADERVPWLRFGVTEVFRRVDLAGF